MAQVNVGSINSETFSLSVFHSGSSKVNVMLTNDLLPSDSQEWLVGVHSLTAPLDSTRYLDEQHGELFMLCKIKQGLAFTEDNYLLLEQTVPGYPGVVSNFGPQAQIDATMATWKQDDIGRLRHDRVPCLEFGDLLEIVNSWVSKINAQIRRRGLNKAPAGASQNDFFQQAWETNVLGNTALDDQKKRFRHIMVRVSPSGMLSVIGSKLFWKCFFIRVSPYMQTLTGFPEFLHVNLDNVNAPTIQPQPVQAGVAPPTMNGAAVAAFNIANTDWMETVAITSNRSLWGSADTRLSVSLETSLPVRRSLTLTDERQCRDFTLGTFPLNNVVSVVNQVSDQFLTDFSISSQSRAGHVSLKDARAPIHWVGLRPTEHLRQIRLQLMVRERIWNPTTKKWSVVHRELPIHDHQTWSAVLVFAKKTH
jgi:hypothetical protein